MAQQGVRDLERLIETFYSAAFHQSWREFRAFALDQLCEATGAVAAAWLTRSATDLPGEYAVWPPNAAIAQAEVAAISFAAGIREQTLKPVPAAWRTRATEGCVLASHVTHRNTPMRSVVCLVFEGEPGEREALRRAVGHLVQAGTLALSQFIQRDEWLQALGRPSRGSAALIDAKGGIYVASRRFQEMLADQFGAGELSSLPFALPPGALDDGRDDFDMGTLHFRLAREGELLLLHARRPHPLDVLSPREQQIALALAEGKTFKSVARECDIAISTVANHASRIYKKLGIYRREELVGLLRSAATPQASAA